MKKLGGEREGQKQKGGGGVRSVVYIACMWCVGGYSDSFLRFVQTLVVGRGVDECGL